MMTGKFDAQVCGNEHPCLSDELLLQNPNPPVFTCSSVVTPVDPTPLQLKSGLLKDEIIKAVLDMTINIGEQARVHFL